MTLLVDIGNTRVKWAILHDGALSCGTPVPHREQSLQATWPAMWGHMPPPGGVIVANVAGSAVAASLAAWASAHWALQPQFITAMPAACGVTNGYSEPGQLGVDRWLALIGARHLKAVAGQHVCVIGCGTALTVDILSAAGQHLGGWIAPGIEMMRQQLSRGTAALSGEFTRQSGGKGLGHSTEEAVMTGIRQAAAGMVDRAVLTARTLLEQPPVGVVTGGAADDLVPFLSSETVTVPDLVLRGLAAFVLQRD